MNNGPEDIQFERDARASVPRVEATGALDLDHAGSGDPPLEAALRRTLEPEFPPIGFADRVMARALAGDRPQSLGSKMQAHGNLLHWPQRRLWITGAIAAALVAGILEGGVAFRRVREQQRRIVEATQQFQTTERVTVHALAQAREQLQRAGVPLSLD